MLYQLVYEQPAQEILLQCKVAGRTTKLLSPQAWLHNLNLVRDLWCIGLGSSRTMQTRKPFYQADRQRDACVVALNKFTKVFVRGSKSLAVQMYVSV